MSIAVSIYTIIRIRYTDKVNSIVHRRLLLLFTNNHLDENYFIYGRGAKIVFSHMARTRKD